MRPGLASSSRREPGPHTFVSDRQLVVRALFFQAQRFTLLLHSFTSPRHKPAAHDYVGDAENHHEDEERYRDDEFRLALW